MSEILRDIKQASSLAYNNCQVSYRPSITYKIPELTLDNPQNLRSELREYFLFSYTTYESLFENITHHDGWYCKANPLRHPLIFYFGHTAVFYVNKLLLARLVQQRVNPLYESMLAVGADEMSWDDLNQEHFDWPEVDAVKKYRDRVKEIVLDIIDNAPLELPLDWNNPWWMLMMAIEHELIHLETSSVLIRQLDLNLVSPHQDWQPCRISSHPPQNELVHVPDTNIVIGKSKTDPYYGWDNEYGYHQAHVKGFKAAKFLVSNQEFLYFVNDAGYLNDSYWEQEGLAWRNYSNPSHPTFWVNRNGKWCLRLMAEEISMPWDWPVEVNYHEAKAFCNWKKAATGLNVRLPTEDEWYSLLKSSDSGDRQLSYNRELRFYASSCPVNTFAHGEFFDLCGNAWQWTETPIYPFQEFEPHPLYDDFSLPTFDGKHNLIKGGSWISCGNEALFSSRYAFRRHFFQHAGFRYIVADQLPSNNIEPKSLYESDKLLGEYMELHYGPQYFSINNFAKTIVDIALNAFGERPKKRALDLGCGVGRSTFELAREFNTVEGIDSSVRFINSAVKLKSGETVNYKLKVEGDLFEYKEIALNDLKLDSFKDRVDFRQADACNLKPCYSNYDLVLAVNLIDRLDKPRKFLEEISLRINTGGILVIASPYTWLNEFTPKENWLGGFKHLEKDFTTLMALKEVLLNSFRLVQDPQNVPFIIRETKRKYQYIVSEVTIWEKFK